MSKFLSRRAEVGLARETTRGTPVVPAHWLPWAQLTFGDQVEKVIEESALGRIEASDNSYNTIKYGEGSLEADVRVAYLGLILTNLLGAAPSTAGGNPYTHTFTLAQNNQHASLSLLVQDKTNTDIVKLFAMTMINKWTLKVAAGEIVKNSIDFVSQPGRDWTSQTSSFTAMGLKFLHQHLVFKVAANTSALAAATAISVKQLELSIEKNVLRNDVAGSVTPEDLNNQDFRVTGSLMLNYEDSTWLDYMVNNSDRAMQIQLNAGAAGILTLQFPLVHFESWAKDMPLNQIAKQKIDFIAHYDAANAVAMISTCTLANAVASY
jgi:hypothetical protein